MSAQSNSTMSLYIPHIFPNYTREDVTQVFENLLGKIKNIDFVSKIGQDGKEFNAAYVHFEDWYDTIAAKNFQSRVQDPTKEARLVYDEPWYWIVLENKARKYVPGERKPRIDLTDLIIPTKKSTMETPKATTTEALKAPVKSSVISQKLTANIKPINLEKMIDSAFPSLSSKPLAIAEKPLATEDLDEVFEDFLYETMLFDEMDACQEDMLAEDSNLVSIDARYVQTLEEENLQLHNQIYELTMRLQELDNSLYTSEAKSQAFAEALVLISKSKN
jgi:hypothetical protein